ncbi:short-chain dehydrogenase/reductase SDR [Catenulispora acidiphila DSM 44928]|uniref:Short-chain dehydrogenase/reductase SDR n=1 Tax=Catenulispora acidiphila (strain DSM 44928 / JCM 14897 / NBRC 102108 / NRRL B-24433 / ID139908) TaxID=479433 RepID=C7PWR2_CATAD|nr:SDR family oxidoreductase [Catenulispora acidiphila]ACU75342.1 short-chain dehydrogenase/reductase SDR [Catenulispora acidiphila DSM 44928]
MTDRKTALITGSTSGIGLAVARRLAAEGWRVALNSARSAEAGAELAAELPEAVYLRADLAAPGEPERLVAEAAEALGGLDLLVNNAGRTQRVAHADLEGAPLSLWRDVFELNVFAAWAATVAAVPYLRGSGGSIINVSSVAGERPAGSSVPYAASKAALAHLTRLLANALGPDIRVNAVAPGLIDTPWTAEMTDIREHVEAAVPLRRLGTPEDVADAVWGLIGSGYTTGQVLLADGGAHLI